MLSVTQPFSPVSALLILSSHIQLQRVDNLGPLCYSAYVRGALYVFGNQ